jgi:glycosyltransferase involved in cell wall biosynthesis
MKILIVTSAFSHFDGDFRGSFLADMAVQLDHAGHKVSVVAPRYCDPQKKYLPAITRRYYRFLRTSSYYGLAESTAKDALSWITLVLGMALSSITRCIVDKPDVIHAFLVIPAGFVSVMVGKLFKIPVVVVGGGSDLKRWPKKPWARPFIRFTLSQAGALIAIGSDIAKIAQAMGAVRGKISVFLAPAGLSAESVKFDEEFEAPRERAIVTVCRLVDGKRVDLLLDAFSRCITDLAGVKLWVAGDGPKRKLFEEQAERMDISESVRFFGSMPRGQALALVTAAECFVLISDSEGVSYACLEALTLGKPVIASAVGGIPDVLVDGENGYLVQPGDTETLVKRIVAVCGDASLRTTMGTNAKRFIADRLGPKSVVARLEDIYNAIIDEKN